jgi:glycosyltransferase involved in cell wall biosynthesis
VIKTAYVFPQGDLGGAEIATLRVLAAHDRSEANPSALLLAHGPLERRLSDLRIPFDVAPERPRLRDRASVTAVRRWLAEAFRRHETGLVHSVMAWTHTLVSPAVRAVGVPEVWALHTPPSPSSAIDWWAALADTRLVIANSGYTASRFRALNWRRHRVEVVHPPIELPADHRPASEVRRELGAADGDLLALLPGRLERSKGQDLAIRACAALARSAIRRAPIRLVIVGGTAFGIEPGYPGALEALAVELGIADRVKFTGFRADLPDLYAAADVVLQPSRNPEGFGLVAAEAQAAGRPVIATAVGGTAEVVVDGETGLLVPPGDERALVSALELLSDPTRRTAMGAAATARPAQTAARAARRLEELYREVVA